MFDVARVLALLWGFAVVVRARARVEVWVLGVVAYFFGLAMVSGFTIRSEGALPPMMALLLALIGPTALPRGALPPVPFGFAVVHWPAIVEVLSCLALAACSRRVARQIDALPESSLETRRLDRVDRALVLIAAFAAISAGTRLLPTMLDWGWGGGTDPIFEDAPALAPP